jgi:hypothetical protein
MSQNALERVEDFPLRTSRERVRPTVLHNGLASHGHLHACWSMHGAIKPIPSLAPTPQSVSLQLLCWPAEWPRCFQIWIHICRRQTTKLARRPSGLCLAEH